MTGVPLVTQIVAMAENGVIGVAGALPWHLPEDLKFFKAMTLGRPMIVGRKTFDSFGGRPLPGRLNVVVTRSPLAASGLVAYVDSLDAAFALCARECETWGDEVVVAGGGEIYRAAMPRTDRIWVTVIHKTVKGDTLFPGIPADFVPTETAAFAEPFAYTRTLYVRMASVTARR